MLYKPLTEPELKPEPKPIPVLKGMEIWFQVLLKARRLKKTKKAIQPNKDGKKFFD